MKAFNQVWHHVTRQASSQVCNQVECRGWYQVRNQIKDQVSYQVSYQVWIQVSNHVRSVINEND